MKLINLFKHKANKFIRFICQMDCGNPNVTLFCTACNIITLMAIIFTWYVIHFVK